MSRRDPAGGPAAPFVAIEQFVAAIIAFAGARIWSLGAAICGGAALEGLGLAALVPLLATLTGRSAGRLSKALDSYFADLGAHNAFERAATTLILFVALIALRAFVLSMRDRRQARLQFAFVEHERGRLLAALGAAGWGEIAGLRHARVLHALDDNLERAGMGAQVVMVMAGALAMLAAQLLLTALIAPAMAWFAAAIVGAGALALAATLPRAWREGCVIAGGRAALHNSAAQMLGGFKTAIAQGLQAHFIGELAQAGEHVANRRLALSRRYSATRIAGSTFASAAGAAAILYGVWRGVPPVALLVVIAVLARMVGPLMAIQQNAYYLMEYLPGYFAQVALREEVDGSPRVSSPPAVFSGAMAPIQLDQVGYHYRGRAGDGISHVSMCIGDGEFLGISGASGAGKTTLLDLVAGMLEPQSGGIHVGGKPLDDRALPAWRAQLAYVGQDPYLFNDSLRRNLLFGAADAADADLAEALELVGAREFVASLPEGLDTIVGERGAQLSGGQRQRILLARALLRRPRTLILDEATNAIDIVGEQEILARLRALSPRPTTLIVAHRQETLAMCDRCIELTNGALAPSDSSIRGFDTPSGT